MFYCASLFSMKGAIERWKLAPRDWNGFNAKVTLMLVTLDCVISKVLFSLYTVSLLSAPYWFCVFIPSSFALTWSHRGDDFNSPFTACEDNKGILILICLVLSRLCTICFLFTTATENISVKVTHKTYSSLNRSVKLVYLIGLTLWAVTKSSDIIII